MIVLKRTVQSPLDLRGWFPPNQPVGTLFLPAVTDLQVGQEICLWLQMPELGVNLHMIGTVIFRRLNALPTRPPQPPGSGLALRPGFHPELRFLQRLLTTGAGPIAQRRHVRTPVLAPWEARVVLPTLRLWSPATVIEISLGGARVELDLLPLAEGTLLQMDLPWHSEANHPLELAWFRIHDNRVLAGLKRPASRSSLDEESWEELVARAMEHFRSRVREK